MNTENTISEFFITFLYENLNIEASYEIIYSDQYLDSILFKNAQTKQDIIKIKIKADDYGKSDMKFTISCYGLSNIYILNEINRISIKNNKFRENVIGLFQSSIERYPFYNSNDYTPIDFDKKNPFTLRDKLWTFENFTIGSVKLIDSSFIYINLTVDFFLNKNNDSYELNSFESLRIHDNKFFNLYFNLSSNEIAYMNTKNALNYYLIELIKKKTATLNIDKIHEQTAEEIKMSLELVNMINI